MKQINIEIDQILDTTIHDVKKGTIAVEVTLNPIMTSSWKNAFKQVSDAKCLEVGTPYSNVTLKLRSKILLDISNIEPTLLQGFIDEFLKPVITDTNKAVNDLMESSKSIIDDISI